MNTRLNFLKNKYVWVGVVVVLGAVYFFTSGGEQPKLATVVTGQVVEEVAITGKTKPTNSVDIGFDNSGRVATSPFKVGDNVSAGQVVSSLDISAELATLSKEESVLAEEEAKLGDEGSRIESSIREAYSVADNAVRNKIDQFFKTPRTNPVFEVKFSDGNFTHYFDVPTDLAIEINNDRRNVETVLTKYQNELTTLNSSNSKTWVNAEVEKMNVVSRFLDKVAYAVNSFTPANFAYDSTVAGYKTAIDSARSSVSTARDGLINASSQGQARVDQTRASIASLRASLNKSRIVAPFSGVITRMDAKVGETATVGTSLVSIASIDSMYIEAPVSEIKIGKIKIGDEADITFDAFGPEVFKGKVAFIEPGETVVDNIPNYNVRLEIPNDPRFKVGLTANVSVKTSIKENVLVIPSYALTKRDGKYYVNKMVDGKKSEIEIGVGLIGVDGNAELISGLGQGDQVAY